MYEGDKLGLGIHELMELLDVHIFQSKMSPLQCFETHVLGRPLYITLFNMYVTLVTMKNPK